MKVYVHLAYGFSESAWGSKWVSGQLIGLNEQTPYGYGQARRAGVEVIFSTDQPEGRLTKLMRLGCRWLLGFDMVHAWRNRAAMRAADVIWTHTESQHLAVASFFLAARLSRKERPVLIAQSVWLFDRWSSLSPVRRLIFRRLLRQADVLTVLSPLNLAAARQLVPDVPSELVLFGIPIHEKRSFAPRPPRPSVRILALGNDVHRDWRTLVDVMRAHPEWRLDLVSKTADPDIATGVENVVVRSLRSNDELRQLFEEASLFVLPLKPNLHASGITAMQEAAIKGLPIIASDVGGLREYFSEEAVCYIGAEDAEALGAAIARIVANPSHASIMAERAHSRMDDDGLSATAYVHRHLELSQRFMEARAVAPPSESAIGPGQA